MKKITIEVADDEVLVALKRHEGYEDVHPELVVEDAIKENWPGYRTLEAESGGEIEALRAEPVAWRSRYRSEPGMLGHYPWTYSERARGLQQDPRYEWQPLYAAPTTEAGG